jgi:hypothetical protein
MKEIMSIRKIFILIILCSFIEIQLKAQVSIINVNVQPFNIVPEALLNVGIMNNGADQQVQIVTQLYNSSGDLLLSVKSQPFKISKGLNPGLSGDRKTASTEYSTKQQSAYLKTTHNLPSGRYKICSSLFLASGADKIDDFCDELEAEFNQYLYLVNPFDNDTIDMKNPILSWTHSEPFTILNQGEFYRMVVSEMKRDQAAEEAITVNSPVMVKNYLKEHQLQYPYDAKELKPGAKYAWQVQKISDGVVINKTEAWMFNTRNTTDKKSLKYVAVKNILDGSFYTAYNGEVFFKFSEEYKTPGNLKFSLTDSRSTPIDITILKDELVKTESGEAGSSLLKQSGDNRYELNLDAKKLKSGFYTLTVKNEKNESFYLKIFLP